MTSTQAKLLGLLAAVSLAAPVSPSPGSETGLLAVRVGRAETVAHGTIEHAVILIENGKIVVVGQDLEIERGIPVLDRPDWVVIPGLVDCHSRVGMQGSGGSGSEPQVLASAELYPRQDEWREVLETGITTLGLYPNGRGIPGQAVAVRPAGETVEEMIVGDRAYLMIYLQSSSSSKKMLRDGFEDVDKYLEKEQKAFEKWEKAQEKKKKSKKDDDDKDKDDEDDEYSPPEPDEDVVPFMQLREGTLSALIEISRASDWLHLLDAIGEEEFAWDLRVNLVDDIDLHYVIDAIGEHEKRIVVEPRITLMPHTRRERNLPAELLRAGAHVAFVPTNVSSETSRKNWRRDVAHVVASGLDAADALRAMTLVPAQVLRVDDRVGSIEAGKDANLVFLNGDPLEPATRVQAVMLEGEFVTGEEEVKL